MKSKIYAYLTLFLVLITVISCKDDDEPTPQAAATFTASKTTAQVDETIQFTNTSENATAFEWSFGDGTTSKNISPTKSYQSAGTFLVSLVSTGVGGSTISNMSITVVPTSAFTVEDADNLVALTPVQFTNASKGATSYLWSFGNEAASTSTEQNPTFTYLKSGTYKVTLATTSAEGTTTSEKQIVVKTASPEIYFVEYGNDLIKKLALDGSAGVTTFLDVAGISGPGMAYDDVHGKIYFTDFTTTFEGKVWRVNLDGTELEELVTGLVEPYGIALDVAEGKMYWADETDNDNIGHISRANLDGTEREDLVSLDNGGFRGIALDLESRKMYYSAQYAKNIYVANMDGSGATVLVPGAYGFALAVDPKNHKLYFEDYMQDLFQMSDLDGTNIATVDDTGATRIYGIAIDSEQDKLYWSSRDAGSIFESNMDGSENTTLKSGLSSPRGIFLRK